jgi:hypothetical protein
MHETLSDERLREIFDGFDGLIVCAPNDRLGPEETLSMARELLDRRAEVERLTRSEAEAARIANEAVATAQAGKKLMEDMLAANATLERETLEKAAKVRELLVPAGNIAYNMKQNLQATHYTVTYEFERISAAIDSALKLLPSPTPDSGKDAP